MFSLSATFLWMKPGKYLMLRLYDAAALVKLIAILTRVIINSFIIDFAFEMK